MFALESLPMEKELSFRCICKKLEDSFGKSPPIHLLQEGFFKKKRGPRESFAEFADSLRVLGGQAFGSKVNSQPNQQFEDLLINRFVSGLDYNWVG